jgi:hypothetical protein
MKYLIVAAIFTQQQQRTTKQLCLVSLNENIGCSFKSLLKIGVGELIVNAPRISCLILTLLLALFVF